MNPILRNVLAVAAGCLVGGLVNFGLITLGSSIVIPPEGIDMSNMESIRANIHLFQAKHFIMPFIAHAVGTLAGAFTTTKIAATPTLPLAMIIGFFFLMGGTSMIANVGGPMWFIILDLAVAYLPMAWLGWKLAGSGKSA